MTDEKALRKQICRIGKLMHRAHLVDGAAGNISARLDDDRILLTPSGLAKGFMHPDQLLILNLNGEVLEAPAGLKPSTETPMHLEVYRQRPDVGGVVHAHPPFAVALTIAGVSMQEYTIPEAIILLGEIPTAHYATPATDEDRTAIMDLVKDHDAMLLAYHGSLTVGADVWGAYLRLETLEHNAHLTYLVRQLGGGKALTPEQIEKLLELRRLLV